MRGFRAWHTKLNRYLRDDEFFIDAEGKVRNDSFGRGNYEEAFDTSDFDSGYIILEQDTGLKDKNGKKICEGDVVKFADLEMAIKPTGIVCFANGRFFVKDWDFGDGSYHIVDFYDYNIPHNDFEVIGNVHENPELLEEEE